MTSKLLKLMSASILAIGLAITSTSLPASAQIAEPEIEAYEEDDGFDWGWLGLLGLIGLAGLSRGNRQPATVAYQRDPNATPYRDPNR